MSTPQSPIAYILVDAKGQNGRCSHCGKAANIVNTHHCGAVINGGAINLDLSPRPTVADSVYVNSLLRAKDIPFVGAGRIITHDGQHSLRRTMRPSDFPN